jgi:hypothetical protein
MELNFNEANFLMHCIELFVGYETDCVFVDCEKNQIIMNSTEINDLFLKIQDIKFERN